MAPNWFAAQDSTELFFSAVSEAELRTGAAILPAGKLHILSPPPRGPWSGASA